MERTPPELICMIGQELTSHDLFSLSRANRNYWKWLLPLLYRQHALREDRQTGSAIVKVVESTDPDKPEARKTSLHVLETVAQFCHLEAAVLDRFRPTTRAYAWFDTGSACRLAFACRVRAQLMYCPLSPLHVAVLKGLDDIAAWLLDRGASIDAPIPGTNITALTLAVLGKHVPSALLLLDNGADPGPRLSERDTHDPPTFLQLVCTLGRAELADQLLARQYLKVDSTELLEAYQAHCPSDAFEFAAVLVRHGAEVSTDHFCAFLRSSKWLSAWELLASPLFSDHLTMDAANSMLREVVSLKIGGLARHTDTFLRILHHLLGRGADPNLGRLLWRESGSVDYPVLLKLLAPFLKAGMDVKPGPRKRRRDRRHAAVTCVDLLGYASAYDKSQSEEGVAAQLSVISVLLQHGAPIGGATRGDALDSYPAGSDKKVHGRAGWSYKLCHVLLRHCHSMAKNERGEDVVVFLNRFAKAQERERSTLVTGL